ncbi:MAG: hypothetical protein NTW04_02575 [Elusimicrobia bacterium]|nr:hypothetical protein [Elusimicrobiota bacterium]
MKKLFIFLCAVFSLSSACCIDYDKLGKFLREAPEADGAYDIGIVDLRYSHGKPSPDKGAIENIVKKMDDYRKIRFSYTLCFQYPASNDLKLEVCIMSRREHLEFYSKALQLTIRGFTFSFEALNGYLNFVHDSDPKQEGDMFKKLRLKGGDTTPENLKPFLSESFRGEAYHGYLTKDGRAKLDSTLRQENREPMFVNYFSPITRAILKGNPWNFILVSADERTSRETRDTIRHEIIHIYYGEIAPLFKEYKATHPEINHDFRKLEWSLEDLGYPKEQRYEEAVVRLLVNNREDVEPLAEFAENNPAFRDGLREYLKEKMRVETLPWDIYWR